MLSDYDLSDRNAVVIGGGRGIGRAIAMVLAEHGAGVAIVSPSDSCIEAAELINRSGGKAHAHRADARSLDSMLEAVEQLSEDVGDFDVVVNSVGESSRIPLIALPGIDGRSMTEDHWRTTLELNLTPAFAISKAFGPGLLDRRQGSVIHVSGFAGIRAAIGRCAYGAAKAGLIRFCESLALEWAPFGVRVNAIAPGTYPDPDQMTPSEYAHLQEVARTRIPIGRVGRLREIGLMAAFLASDAAGNVTGQTFVVDGGITISSAGDVGTVADPRSATGINT